MSDKKKVGIITFHAAHNYGSNLQAYALQQYVSGLGYDCEIINFRSFKQKEQYKPLTKRKGLKYIAKNAYFLITYRNRKRKYDKFEDFIENKLVKSSKEYNSLEELANANLDYDYYISGSDQIWKTTPYDADMSYFLPFVKRGKRISYAPSCGQIEKSSNIDQIGECLRKYDNISVREENGVSLVEKLTGITPPVLIDPTFLIDRTKWLSLCSERVVDGDYIFFYTLFATKESIEIAKRISEFLKIPVVISNISNQYEIFSGFVKKTWVGPQEFLSLVSNAKFVVGTSFHCMAFSIIFNKPFFAINGMADMRICTILTTMGLESRSVKAENLAEKLRAFPRKCG